MSADRTIKRGYEVTSLFYCSIELLIVLSLLDSSAGSIPFVERNFS